MFYPNNLILLLIAISSAELASPNDFWGIDWCSTSKGSSAKDNINYVKSNKGKQSDISLNCGKAFGNCLEKKWMKTPDYTRIPSNAYDLEEACDQFLDKLWCAEDFEKCLRVNKSNSVLIAAKQKYTELCTEEVYPAVTAFFYCERNKPFMWRNCSREFNQAILSSEPFPLSQYFHYCRGYQKYKDCVLDIGSRYCTLKDFHYMIKVLSTQHQINCIGCQHVGDHHQEVNLLTSGGTGEEVAVGLVFFLFLVRF